MKKTDILSKNGVILENPGSIVIDDDIVLENIEPGAVLNQGTRLSGNKTYISKGCVIGTEGPVTIKNSVFGENVKLGSGYFEGSVFLESSKAGSNSHVRPGTIIEEHASFAHTVGLKQTILFPFVTLGSLINFCDCMMTGGTSSKNHSEVGSSFIHFNFTPNQDKATPSLLGDVQNGVFLDKKPIFLGGQGGMVGPLRLGFGNVTGAGSIIRNDELREDRLIIESSNKNLNLRNKAGLYPSLERILKNNFNYISSLIALKNWYLNFRINFLNDKISAFSVKTLDESINERIKRIVQVSDKIKPGLSPKSSNSELGILKADFCSKINLIKEEIEKSAEDKDLLKTHKNKFMEKIDFSENRNSYIETIKNLNPELKESGSDWLNQIITDLNTKLFNIAGINI